MIFNRLKKLVFLCLLFMLSSVIYNNAGASCDSPFNCDNAQWVDTTDVLELPGFDSCYVKFWYRYRICIDDSGKHVVEFDVYGFQDPDSSVYCDELLDSLMNPDGSPNWSFISWVFRQGFPALAKKLFLQELNWTPDPLKYKYYCPNYEVTYAATWKSCAQIGVFYIYSPHYPFPRLKFVIQPCDDLICCLQTLKICWDTQLNRLVIDEQFEYLNGECEQNPPPIPGAIFSSHCLQWCVEPNE